MTIGMPGLRK